MAEPLRPVDADNHYYEALDRDSRATSTRRSSTAA